MANAIAPYEFAVLNAIPRELAAMEKVFGPLRKIPADRGVLSHELAIIQKANGAEVPVVVAGVTTAGTIQTASVVASLAQQLPYLKMVLLVGVAAGQPNLAREEHDVWLGDVVISGSVVQYDHIKRHPDGSIECRGQYLPVPSPRLLRTASELKSEMEALPAGPWSWERLIDDGIAAWPHAARPPVHDDPNHSRRDYTHTLHRHATDRPHLHIGKIGSANTLLKDGAFRDRLHQEHGTIAYEMEGAGLAIAASEFNLQYLIVRGICDYADETKGDRWQRYAALAAASAAKSVLVEL